MSSSHLQSASLPVSGPEHKALRADAVTLLLALQRMSRSEHLSLNVKAAMEQLERRIGITHEVDPDDEWQGP